MDKRSFLKKATLAGAGAMIVSQGTMKAVSNTLFSSTDESQGFTQVALKYSFEALEPYIDAKTMEIHYSKHHAAYTKNFNAFVKDLQITETSIEKIFGNISKYPVGLRNNGGGLYNHNLYFSIMGPGAGGEPTGILMDKIQKDFGSFTNFKDNFSKAGSTVFGSGWVWLIVKDNALQITTSPNQDNPLMDISPIQGKPILCMDVWEHAYYLHYQNRRTEYISAFWNVINWNQVSLNFQK